MASEFIVKYRGVKHTFALDFDRCTLKSLGERLQELTSAYFPTQKLIGRNIKGVLKLAQHRSLSLRDAGVVPNKMYTLMGSPVEAVRQIQAQKDVPHIIGFDEEMKREAKERSQGTPSIKPPNSEYTFKSYQVLQKASLYPPPSRAKELLYRLANDPGIFGLMQKHKWKVGLLKELRPKGKVGISRRCLLGYNRNRGQEISLRLRTDDLKGFRKYLSIRETLIHELTHMVWTRHTNKFKELNSQLLQECDQFVRQSQGGVLIDDGAAAPDDVFEIDEGVDDRRLLGGAPSHTDPVSAAREAALRREAREVAEAKKSKRTRRRER